MSKPTVVDIQIAVAQRFGVSVLDLIAEDRSQRVSVPRQMAFWVARANGRSLRQIGVKFARDNATVLHGLRAIQRRMDADADLSAVGAELRDHFAWVDFAVWAVAPTVTFSAEASHAG